MSHAHHDEFHRIKREYERVVRLLDAATFKTTRDGKVIGQAKPGDVPRMTAEQARSAVATANDAYALLLIATAERYLREYLISINVRIVGDPNLIRLIQRCRKEFNDCNPTRKIRRDDEKDMDDLRRSRNDYANGIGSWVFPTIGRAVDTLGRFFYRLPS